MPNIGNTCDLDLSALDHYLMNMGLIANNNPAKANSLIQFRIGKVKIELMRTGLSIIQSMCNDHASDRIVELHVHIRRLS